MKNKLMLIVLAVLMLTGIVGCAPGKVTQIDVPAVSIQINQPGKNPLVNTPDANGKVAGVLMGLWHGVISPVTLVFSLMNADVQMYEVHNDAIPYNFGFLLGVGIVFALLGVLVGSGRH